ncbi:hypothetical protein [Rubellicoccus peritrichatus]|uniref:MFS transporter n=1 Tax=Rubellicoccus peritrichatus TaxID=3080537 RepID=A0AAQ3LFU4_9BACT|nr:hypothetical protein [Puniceicoccus sp. CR14]WOO43018.1 hypothetical protein RZN69_07925 [Puniceicoccus sp. CR14]
MKARKVFLLLFIGFLSLTALVAIISVLSGDFGKLQLKILATTFTISSASICAMSCAAFIEKKKSRVFGSIGISFAAISAILVITGVWLELDQEAYWKSTITFIVFGIGFAHAFLLIMPDLDDSHKWIQIVSSISIAVLALQIVGAVWSEVDHSGYYKLLSVVSIVVVLLTLVIPILMKMDKKPHEIIAALTLIKNQDGTYRDKHGIAYKVTKIDNEQKHKSDPQQSPQDVNE